MGFISAFKELNLSTSSTNLVAIIVQENVLS